VTCVVTFELFSGVKLFLYLCTSVYIYLFIYIYIYIYIYICVCVCVCAAVFLLWLVSQTSQLELVNELSRAVLLARLFNEPRRAGSLA
jgi:hypothetical protein